MGRGVGSSNNTALVTGAYSALFIGNMYVGQYSAGNELTVSDGGKLTDSLTYVGDQASSSNNAVLITGVDSVCSNRYDLFVGYRGAGNTLTLSNGAHAACERSMVVGREASATGNRVQISGGRLTVTNASGSGLIVVGRSGGGLLQVDDGTVLADVMVLVTNAGAVGTVNVTGGEVKLTGVGSVIGFAGAADFNVSGGEFRSAGLTLGGGGGSGNLTLSGGAAEATGPWAVHTGGLWVDGGTLLATNAGAGITIGTGGAAQMTVSNGLVRAGEIRIGNGADSGILTVAGGIVTGGAVVVTSTGVLRLDVPIDSVVSNLGDVQVSASDYTFRGGLHNLGGFAVGGTQILHVQNGLANSGSLVLDSGGALTADAFVESRHDGTTLLHGGASLTVNSVWTNTGAMSLDGGSVNGSAVQNAGLIEGWGSIQASLENGTGGIVRASGGLLSLGGLSVQNLAGGTMEALEGATLGLARDFDNSGILHNRGGIVDFSGWTLTNSGVLTGYGTFKAVATYNLGAATFSGGTVAVHGQYVNASGQTTTCDRVVARFHGAATNFGNFKNAGGEVTFLDAFYNNGSFDSDPATNVFADLALGPDGAMTGDTQDVWRVGGAFDGATTNTAYNVSGSTFEFTNPAGQELEQFSRDLGPRLSALANNWAFGTVRLQGATVTLVERRANSSGPDAVYAAALTGTGTLNVGAGMVFYCGNTSGWSGVVNTSGGGVFRFLLPDAEDFDGDGVSNGNECECGTEATNALSVLRIAAMSLEGSDACVTWTTVGGKTYVIQAAPSIMDGPSTNFTTVSAPLSAGGSGEATTNLWIPGAVTNRFFRVLLSP
ncbi:MAG: hypothetical protein KJ579_02050 [Verrucomicrobia bacterium]|nr:hypothetical protein [Verrucomicrobiota bacterium]